MYQFKNIIKGSIHTNSSSQGKSHPLTYVYILIVICQTVYEMKILEKNVCIYIYF